MAEYIEREALLKHAHIGMTRITDTEWQQGYWDGVDDMAEYIREEPTADVAEVKHGEWIGRPLCGNSNCRCSICGSWWNVHANLSGEIMQKYCPNCGAKMDGEGE